MPTGDFIAIAFAVIVISHSGVNKEKFTIKTALLKVKLRRFPNKDDVHSDLVTDYMGLGFLGH